MIYFAKEGFPLKTGINFVSISDGGFAIKLKFKNTIYSVRYRKNNLKPKILFNKISR